MATDRLPGGGPDEPQRVVGGNNVHLVAVGDERTHELAEANTRLAQLAVTDGLTGLYNHRHFHERLTLEVERSQRSGLPLSLLMLDVDHFKLFNDTYGHPAGDEVLRQLARVLNDARRANEAPRPGPSPAMTTTFPSSIIRSTFQPLLVAVRRSARPTAPA